MASSHTSYSKVTKLWRDMTIAAACTGSNILSMVAFGNPVHDACMPIMCCYPNPPPFEISHPCNLPPPCPPGRPSLHCFAWQYLLRWFVLPIRHTHVLALLSHHCKSVTCVFSVIFCLQRRCTGCRVAFSDPSCFLPVTVYGTTHAHLMFDGKLYFTRDICEEKRIPEDLVPPKKLVPAPKATAKPAPE